MVMEDKIISIELESGYELSMSLINTDDGDEHIFLTVTRPKHIKDIVIPISVTEYFTMRQLFRKIIQTRIRNIIYK